jgi:hypothetical protein
MKKVIGLAVLVIVVALCGLRVYGAFETEHSEAVEKAQKADALAAQFLDEYNRIEARVNCDTQWLEYKNHELDNQIAELKGQRKTYRPKPLCDGYADMSLSHSLQEMTDGLNALSGQQNAREYAVAEWKYADNRKLQANYLAAKVWSTLKGTKLPDDYQAKLQQELDKKEWDKNVTKMKAAWEKKQSEKQSENK